jgi:hypothetical protein
MQQLSERIADVLPGVVLTANDVASAVDASFGLIGGECQVEDFQDERGAVFYVQLWGILVSGCTQLILFRENIPN